jgi:hypothetical protein
MITAGRNVEISKEMRQTGVNISLREFYMRCLKIAEGNRPFSWMTVVGLAGL